MGIIRKSEEIQGVLFIFLSALMYATLPILGKLAFHAGLSPSAALLLRYVFSLLLLAVYIGFIKHARILTLTPLVIAQGALLTMGSLFYFYSLKYLSAGITTVIFFFYPVLVACLAVPIYQEKIRPRLIWALLLAIAGIIMVSGIDQDLNGISYPGVVLALLACLCYAIYGLIGQKTVAETDPLSMTATLSLVAVIIISFFANRDLIFLYHLSLNQILIGLTMAVLNTLLAVLFFLKGVKKIGAARASIISTAEPPFCLLLAFLILGETLTLWQLLGSLLVFTSMILASKRSEDSAIPSQSQRNSFQPHDRRI